VIALDDIRQALDRHRPRVTPFGDGRGRAAVALILAGDAGDLSLCFIRRAEAPGDRWSGHMALPGGRAELRDEDATATAVRETREEVGLPLERRHLVGALSELPVRHGSSVPGMVLSGLVYYLGTELHPLTPNHEVAEAFWIPLTHVWDPGNVAHVEWNSSGRPAVYPAIRFRDQVIWGLTFRVLTLFSDVLDRPLPHLEDLD